MGAGVARNDGFELGAGFVGREVGLAVDLSLPLDGFESSRQTQHASSTVNPKCTMPAFFTDGHRASGECSNCSHPMAGFKLNNQPATFTQSLDPFASFPLLGVPTETFCLLGGFVGVKVADDVGFGLGFDVGGVERYDEG